MVVSSNKPEASVTIVKAWAAQFITKINALYSVNANTLSLIDHTVLEASKNRDDAENALKQEIISANVDTRKNELANQQNILSTYLGALTQLDLIITDTQILSSSLAIWPNDSQLAIEYQISLIGLYQRATSGLESSQGQGVQVQIAIPTAENLRTVGEAQDSLKILSTSLVDHKKSLQSSLFRLGQEIATAELGLEAANYQLTPLTAKRDLALKAYQLAFSAQMEETRIYNAREDVVAKPVGQALPPEQPVSNHTLMKTVIAGALAFALSCFGVLFINWWKSPAPAKPAS